MLFHAFICPMTTYLVLFRIRSKRLLYAASEILIGNSRYSKQTCSVSHGDAANFELMPLLKTTKQ